MKKVKELSDKKKVKLLREAMFIEYVAIMDFLMNKHPDIAEDFFSKHEPDCFSNYYVGTSAKIGAKVIKTLSKDLMMNMAINEITKSMQTLMSVNNVTINQTGNEVIIDNPNCPAKKDFYKTAKKCKVTLEKDVFCKEWCTPSFRQTTSPFGFEYSCEHSKNGCIIRIKSV